jgi:hypothetical protein
MRGARLRLRWTDEGVRPYMSFAYTVLMALQSKFSVTKLYKIMTNRLRNSATFPLLTSLRGATPCLTLTAVRASDVFPQ